MIKIPQEVKFAIEKTYPICIATANNEGIPNIIYVGFLKCLNDTTIVIADNKFAKTKNNILANSNISIVVLDPDTRKSYQLKGKTEYIENGEKYQYVVDWVQNKRADIYPKGAVYVTITEIFSGDKKIA
ncbi:MAG: pyridoxamine 5'-phosphate oxidase family protein [Candidatus Margulisbacteria bacterium]|nr:pyridoxamine 5'-phosphate oxidase family protein [Candidatus Margulisiibacteriota bacterium]